MAVVPLVILGRRNDSGTCWLRQPLVMTRRLHVVRSRRWLPSASTSSSSSTSAVSSMVYLLLLLNLLLVHVRLRCVSERNAST